MLARECGDGARHQPVAERRQAGDADTACADLFDLRSPELEAVQADQIGPHLGVEELAFACRHQPAADPVKQAEAQLRFELRQGPAA